MQRGVIGIVGAEAAKFTAIGEQRAREVIRERLASFEALSSGHCHLGGIDIWAEEEAKVLGRFRQELIFPPRVFSWSNGYMPRNIKIARASQHLLNVVVDVLPAEYTGMRFSVCYHCAKHDSNYPRHVKSGGCWTMWKAKEFGATIERVIIQNY